MPSAAQYCIAYEMRLVTEHIWPGKLKKKVFICLKVSWRQLKTQHRKSHPPIFQVDFLLAWENSRLFICLKVSWRQLKTQHRKSHPPIFQVDFLLAWENSRHFATSPVVSGRNDVWETSAEIPYWWRVTTQVWVVLLMAGWSKFPTRHDQSEALTFELLVVCDSTTVQDSLRDSMIFDKPPFPPT